MKKMNCLLVIFVAVAPLWAEGKKPPEKKEKTSHTLQDAKDGANKVLNDIDRGVHKSIKPVKDGANDALNAVDRGVHKVLDPKK
jgi:hypothetical protein